MLREVSTCCRAKRSATESVLKVVAGPDGGGSVRDSGERSLEQIKGGLQGGGLQGPRGRDEACTQAEAKCQEEPQRQQGQQAQWCWGSLAPVQAFISPPTPGPGVSSLSGQKSLTQQPSPSPPSTGQEDRGSRRGATGQGPRSLAESLCSQPLLASPAWVAKSLGRRDASQQGNMSSGHPPPLLPQGPSLPPSPTPTPGMVLSTADQDFMVQKPPEGKGEGATGGPAPGTPWLPRSVCAVGRAGPRRDRGRTRGETGSCSFTFLIRTRAECALPRPREARGDPEATGELMRQ